ncbi:MAG: hypothetical protein ABI137_07715 [Antricoccus sp.]
MNSQGLVQQYRLIIGVGMSAVVMFGLVAFLVIPGQQVNAIGMLLPIVVATGALLACEVIGFRGVIAQSARHDKESTMASARAIFQTTTMLRFALAETPALVGLALAFSAQPPSRVPAWIGAALGFALLARVAYPGRRQISKLQANFEHNGQPSYLTEALGIEPTDDLGSTRLGPIRETGNDPF